MLYYVEIPEVEVDLRCFLRKPTKVTKRFVIETIKVSHASEISCIKFITGRGNHINSTKEREVLCKNFESWLSDTEVSKLIDFHVPHTEHYLVYLNPPNTDSILPAELIAYYENFKSSIKSILIYVFLIINLCILVYLVYFYYYYCYYCYCSVH
ncbi:hypothetical protein C1645_784377 [Glomus cerebriforme]|uniref:Smr domain-containing protein n=1 Tax=Glomus cerebriforme TaxID=658196 RepID=A0A397SHD9_9GLOM|nr:hypothetical protein C1645_784377 [Glomus cerebriforme]